MGLIEAHENLLLRIEPASADLSLIFDSQSGTKYQFQVSTNLTNWTDFGTVIPGDDSSKTQMVSTAGRQMGFYRVQATATSTGPAPSDTEFSNMVVGNTVLGYFFVSATRFDWYGETGDWDYSKTDGTTGKLVFTYDEDGNNPAVYREEVVLTFQTSTQGTYRYSEFYNGSEYAGSVSTGPFDLNNL